MNTTHKNFILGVMLYALATNTSFAQVTVNCPGESINTALAGAPDSGTFTITVNGICDSETVTINRNAVHLTGGTGGGVTGPAPGGTAIIIRGQRVVIDGLIVSDGAANGIDVRENASATIQNSTIQSNATTGVNIRRGAFADLENNIIGSNGTCDVSINDSGTARMVGNTIVSTQADPNVCAGVAVVRDAYVRMQGGNQVTNNTLTGLAVHVAYGSTLRQDGGHDTVSGNVEVGNEGNMEFRDADITGNVDAFYNSVVRLSNSSVTGDIGVNETNVLHFFSSVGPTMVSGTIHCNGGTLSGSGNVTATAIDCPAPLHVLRADGSAKILAEETNAAVAARNMFELINNGPIGFNMTNSSIAQTWRFAAQTTGFRVSLDGTGGRELELGNAGTLAVGPGGASNLFLDASGNLTIAGTLTQSSDRAAKTAITAVNASEVLTKLTTLLISQWAYKSEPTVNHLGPMAQDFKAAFGLGADDTHLAPGDLAGVAVVGVKALYKMIEARDAEIAELKRRLTALEARESRLQVPEADRWAGRGDRSPQATLGDVGGDG